MDGRADRLEDLEFLTRDDLVERKIVGRSMSYAYGDTRSKYYDPDFPKAIKIMDESSSEPPRSRLGLISSKDEPTRTLTPKSTSRNMVGERKDETARQNCRV